MSLLDIQSIFPDIVGSAQKKREEEVFQTQMAANGLEGLAGRSMARMNQNVPARLFQATGNRGLLTGSQNMAQELKTIDPRDPGAAEALLEATRKYSPEKVPAVFAAMEKQRQQAVQEDLDERRVRTQEANQELNAKKFGFETGERWDAYREEQAFNRGIATTRLQNEQTRLGMDERQLRIAEQNFEIGSQRNQREMQSFAVEQADRLRDGDVRGSLSEILKGMDMPELAEGVQSPTASITAILQASTRIQENRIMESIKSAELTAGSPPKEAEIDSWVNAAINDVDTVSRSGTFGWRKEENAPEIAYLLRSFYQGGGYQVADPVERKKLAYEYVERYAGFSKKSTTAEVTSGTTSEDIAAQVTQGITVGDVARPPLGSFEGR